MATSAWVSAARITWAISRSPGTSPSRPSTTRTRRSAAEMARRPRSRTSAWSGSWLAPNMPPVSTSSNRAPCHSAGWAITSRVVPGIDVTIARRVPVKRLNRVDLPTLGRPTKTTERSPSRFRVLSAPFVFMFPPGFGASGPERQNEPAYEPGRGSTLDIPAEPLPSLTVSPWRASRAWDRYAAAAQRVHDPREKPHSGPSSEKDEG